MKRPQLVGLALIIGGNAQSTQIRGSVPMSVIGYDRWALLIEHCAQPVEASPGASSPEESRGLPVTSQRLRYLTRHDVPPAANPESHARELARGWLAIGWAMMQVLPRAARVGLRGASLGQRHHDELVYRDCRRYLIRKSNWRGQQALKWQVLSIPGRRQKSHM